ncbi:MAG TPA: hypothetical protein PK263_06560, partial [bacterium]|nr:hypothetical protein [bacterium]
KSQLFGHIPSERSVEAIGKYVRLYYISRDKHIDLFPRTSAVEKMAVLRSKSRRFISENERTDFPGL